MRFMRWSRQDLDNANEEDVEEAWELMAQLVEAGAVL